MPFINSYSAFLSWDIEQTATNHTSLPTCISFTYTVSVTTARSFCCVISDMCPVNCLNVCFLRCSVVHLNSREILLGKLIISQTFFELSRPVYIWSPRPLLGRRHCVFDTDLCLTATYLQSWCSLVIRCLRRSDWVGLVELFSIDSQETFVSRLSVYTIWAVGLYSHASVYTLRMT